MSTSPTTCLEVAQTRLNSRAIKESTYKNYLGTLRQLDLEDVPIEDVSVAFLTRRLQRVLMPGTRRKHAINLRACLGVSIPCPRATQKVYDLPELEAIHQALAQSPYRLYGFSMLYAGLRIGESLVKQRLEGNVLYVDRQRLPDGSVASSKTTGAVFLPPWFSEAYRGHQPSHSANTVYVGIKRAFRRNGMGSLTCHSLRHAFATNLVRAGASPGVLKVQMRHHDVAVSLRYYVQISQSDIELVMAKL